MNREQPPARGPGFSEMVVYRVVRAIAVGASRLYFPGRVFGRENLPAQGACIVAPVHRSYVDWLIVARITSRRRLRYIVKEEVWRSKLFGAIIEACGGFPVNRSGADREALERCRAVLAGGEALVMFPEGTRRSWPSGRRAEGRRRLPVASHGGVPIVPVGIGGSERAMPRGAKFPRPRRVNVVIGPPVRCPHPPGRRRPTWRGPRDTVPRTSGPASGARRSPSSRGG